MYFLLSNTKSANFNTKGEFDMESKMDKIIYYVGFVSGSITAILLFVLIFI